MAKRRQERRSTTRTEARLTMRLESRLSEEAAAGQIVTESQNISASGVYCHSARYLPPLSRVALTIVLPGLGPLRGRVEMVKCEGVVVRCEQLSTGPRRGAHPFELACAFTDLDEERRRLLEEFVTRRNLEALRAAASGKRPSRRLTNRGPKSVVLGRRNGRAAAGKRGALARRTYH